MIARETVGATIKRISDDFAAVGIETARLDARVLVGAAIGCTAGETALHADRVLADEASAKLAVWSERRREREPIGRIFGVREFWGLSFELVAETLEPRPDSETVVSSVLAACALPAPRVLDLGTGTGCLLIAILTERAGASGVGVDVSAPAVACATRNAVRHGLGERATFRVSDWLANVSGVFDVVVSNPPYLSGADMAKLAPEVRFDPELALAAGADGLAAYRAILATLRPHLAANAVIALELGAGQADTVGALATHYGFGIRGRHDDLAGHPRCLLLAP